MHRTGATNPTDEPLSIACRRWPAAGRPPSAAARGPSVLLAHGFGQTRQSWSATQARLSGDGYASLAFDMRGHGKSDRNPGHSAYTAGQFIGDHVAAAAALGRSPGAGRRLDGRPDRAAGAGAATACSRRWCWSTSRRAGKRPASQRILAFMTAHPEGFDSFEHAAQVIADYLPHRRERKTPAQLAHLLRPNQTGALAAGIGIRACSSEFVAGSEQLQDVVCRRRRQDRRSGAADQRRPQRPGVRRHRGRISSNWCRRRGTCACPRPRTWSPATTTTRSPTPCSIFCAHNSPRDPAPEPAVIRGPAKLALSEVPPRSSTMNILLPFLAIADRRRHSPPTIALRLAVFTALAASAAGRRWLLRRQPDGNDHRAALLVRWSRCRCWSRHSASRCITAPLLELLHQDPAAAVGHREDRAGSRHGRLRRRAVLRQAGLGPAAVAAQADAHRRGAGLPRRPGARKLCRMTNDWEITHVRADLPPEMWEFIKKQQVLRHDHPEGIRRPRLLGAGALTGDPEAGVDVEHASAPPSACPTRWARPNCCCTTAPTNRRTTTCRAWPMAAKSPASRLTGPFAGSDATSIPDYGIVCKGEWNGAQRARHAS